MISAPAWVSVEIMMTGIGRSVMILRRNVTPSMCGISTSSVMTSGLSALIRSRATWGSGAVPTTSISGSADSNVDSNCRITAESSTINTRTGVLIWSLISKQVDFAGRLPLSQPVGIFAFFAGDRVGFAGSQQPAHDAAGRGVIVDASRMRPPRSPAAQRNPSASR